jgi:UPF0176 protein
MDADVKRVLNIAGYRFAALDDLVPLANALADHARRAGITGTILLAPEGINFMLAGGEKGIEGLIDAVRSLPPLGDLQMRRSWSAVRPFKRLRVRIKREIVALKRPDIRPADDADDRITPQELKRWIDEGHDFVLLDARNRFEVAMGSFRGAHDLGLRAFSDLPAALARADPVLRDAMKRKPVVTFCTGGIRCEKAVPLMKELGVPEVLQLDGGILGYFEVCGSAHFSGRCFVFDERVGLDAGS